MPLSTDRGGSDLAEEVNKLAASRRSGRRARSRNTALTCQRLVASAGCLAPGDTRERQGVRFLHTMSFHSSLTSPSSCPWFYIFSVPLIPLHC